jgi:hypothetical protein
MLKPVPLTVAAEIVAFTPACIHHGLSLALIFVRYDVRECQGRRCPR